MRPDTLFLPLKQDSKTCRKDTLRNSGPKVKKDRWADIFQIDENGVSLIHELSGHRHKTNMETGNCTKAHQISSQWGKILIFED